jgi:hypothetical protein
VRDRFVAIAKAETRYSLDELQRQLAFDRALARLFTAPDGQPPTVECPSSRVSGTPRRYSDPERVFL